MLAIEPRDSDLRKKARIKSAALHSLVVVVHMWSGCKAARLPYTVQAGAWPCADLMLSRHCFEPLTDQ